VAFKFGEACIGLFELRGHNFVRVLLLGEILTQARLSGIPGIAQNGDSGKQQTETARNPARVPDFCVMIRILRICRCRRSGLCGYSTQSRLSQDLAKQQDTNKVMSAQLEQANTRLAELKGHVEVTEQKVGMTVRKIAEAKSRSSPSARKQAASDRNSPPAHASETG